MERRIAAILACDMVGFSRLVETDEEGTLTRQKRYRLELIEPSISKFNGNIIKFTGDGLLAEFSSVVEAVQCAIHLQQEISAREEGREASKKISYRMAVNLGDVIFDDGDIFGDGVNVAARLESIAPAGGLVISGAAYDLLKNQVQVDYQSLGKKKLKNIASPVRVYSVLPVNLQNSETKKLSRRFTRPGMTVLALVAILLAGPIFWVVSSSGDLPDLEFRLEQMARDAQQRLTEENYLVEYDPGIFGVNTRMALADFQLDHGLPETGILCADTASALGVPMRILGADWDNVIANRRKAMIRHPEVFSVLTDDQRLSRVATVFEGMEFAFSYFNDHLYVAVLANGSTPWSDAVRLSKQANGYLAAISSSEENSFAFDLSTSDAKFWVLGDSGSAWIGPTIGLFQKHGAPEPSGGWSWMNGEPISYTNWARGQPNNWGGVNERTASFYSQILPSLTETETVLSPTWNDEREWVHSFLVEIE
ncbi:MULTISPECIES: peptidoglycan-binding protein [unclassified Ruegeria]|uniref:peptidoglycan-binding protein n=1 Tax=unclassified Ruegeria TaxID=2625375 RepID=UPI001487E530|nr:MULTISPECIES: peptidoglycan-binding protein [unclassified Ruegeria]NOD75084.1 hypothetical protein [Ruegeria sp. HKCCD4332]NOD87045.1 hypothetical protein [Ruegeria sp. HKCCD4318]NOE12600.1 hypothetical protein [Ruegeria sp. HKCCD4318-2]NOG09235.1 hypothetical protein [Ruegeria sp. HKCCD4315]